MSGEARPPVTVRPRAAVCAAPPQSLGLFTRKTRTPRTGDPHSPSRGHAASGQRPRGLRRVRDAARDCGRFWHVLPACLDLESGPLGASKAQCHGPRAVVHDYAASSPQLGCESKQPCQSSCEPTSWTNENQPLRESARRGCRDTERPPERPSAQGLGEGATRFSRFVPFREDVHLTVACLF